MSYPYTHRTIIVPAAFQQLAQGLCETVAEGDAGKGMFTTGLSANGKLPATHYISSGHIEQQFADILPFTTVNQDGEGLPDIHTRPGNVEAVEYMAAQAGISLPPGTVAALFSAIDVSEQEPFTALTRLGLQITQPKVALSILEK